MKFRAGYRQTWLPPAWNLFAAMNTPTAAEEASPEIKKAAFSRGLLELFGHARCPLPLLLGRIARLWSGRLRRCARGLRSRRFCGGRCCGSRNAGLHVVSVDDRLGDVH